MLILVGYRGKKMVRNIGMFQDHTGVNTYVQANQTKLLNEFNNLKVEEIVYHSDYVSPGSVVTAIFTLGFQFQSLESEDRIELCDPEEKAPCVRGASNIW